ncbi:M-phase-specific PLK1-interacting protein [Salarias fasciatus]|uniref:M-phase-specific PLK1-interacting protein n=1 Tax=Salarias fasciatus TaxID=181472 RepID=UPI0011766F09|nr:M-phase-specific PLK1-interacting protein [Salarias fasciatus]
MFRAPERPQRSPGEMQPAGRHPSPAAGWSFPGARPPYHGHHERSPRGFSPYSTGSPSFSLGSGRGYRNGSPGGYRGFRDSPTGFRGSPRSFGDSPGGGRGGRWSSGDSSGGFSGGPRGYGDSSTGFGSGSRGFGGQRRRRGDGHRWTHSFSPSTPNYKAGSADTPVERYFSPSMVQDPWRNLQPVTATEAAARRNK